jgi:precorrin-6A/cobalt-precorrin-6A reductase
MKNAPRLLLLAGSSEARVIAREAEAMGWAVEAWVSEPPRGANPMPVETVLRRFDDAALIMDQMRGFDVVIDASHGFDAQMTRAGAAAAQGLGVPFMRYARPVWGLEAGWQSAPGVTQAMALIKPQARVFSATGWGSLPEYADFPGGRLFLRQTSKTAQGVPFDFVELVVGEPPFSKTAEVALFKDLRIDTLICRNLGGVPSRPKLDAALELGCEVILIDPPARPRDIATKDRVEDVLEWLAAQ